MAVSMFEGEYKGIKIVVRKGDLTEEVVDAIVNPANSFCVMGGGVALAIRQKGGEVIEKDAMRAAPIRVGTAVMTSAGKLKSRRVIHAPTMERPAEKINYLAVNKATSAAIKVAHENGLAKIAFPGMGTGVGGVRPHEAAKAMEIAFKKYAEECNLRPVVKEFHFVAFNEEMEKEWDYVFSKLVKPVEAKGED